MLFLYQGQEGNLYAQILLESDQPLQVRFAIDDPGLFEGQVIILPQISLPDQLKWIPFNGARSSNQEEVYYLPDGEFFISAGRIQDPNEETATFFTLEISNKAEFGIGALDMAFDFIYSSEQRLTDYALSLRYSVNGRDWIGIPGSRVSTSSFSDHSDEAQWSTFTTQIRIEDIYLRTEDSVRLQWVFTSHNAHEVELNLPLFIQGIDLDPAKHQAADLSRGSFIITEIFPSHRVDRDRFEFIELFNPVDTAIPLKGVEMVTSRGSIVIERDAEIPPYGMIVLSNMDISGLQSVGAFYQYQGDLIPPDAGRVEFMQNGELIAGALFDELEPGRSHELQRAVLAEGSGYSATQNLALASERFAGDLFGSPGTFGSTVPFYKKQITRSGWHLISPPGLLPARFNSHPDLEWFELDGERIRPERIRAYQSVAIYKRDHLPVTLVAEQAVRANRSGDLFSNGHRDSFTIASFTTPETQDVRNISDSRNRQLAPKLLAWDHSAGRFNFRDDYDSQVTNWSPVVFNRESYDNTELSLSTGSLQSAELLEQLSLKLFTGSDNNRILQDEVVIGFTEQERYWDERYDLPVIDGQFTQDFRFPRRDLLYLTLPEASYATNSFIHIPSEARSVRQIGVGFEPRPGTSGQAMLTWTLPDYVADHWNVTLEDLTTGITVDMREENSLRFRYNRAPEEASQEGEVRGLHSFTPSQRNRLVVRLEPMNLEITESVEEERSTNVELHPNYPNPFNPVTTISFTLPEERAVRLGVYNIVGQQVTLLVDEHLRAGIHTIIWDGANSPSGIYIVQLETGGRILTRKMALIK